MPAACEEIVLSADGVARNRKFESSSLQERVHCELDHDVELAVDVETAPPSGASR
jgi:hypothetical protein